ncbi:GNAT superfamily N-acetyltransferase [Sporomusaceae bacterium BoRhaA]|uniref:GNAT family N-acetyltransferase n=1 Tax=Pelorhabdus rhamnosifermentans TaxID=2772457 RepID=UPI001C063F77|nr:GNAT superfamily N-acetyltransferase [Pelorhabdus rhamnosifermentans]
MYNIIADEHVVGNFSFYSKGNGNFWTVIPEYQNRGIGSKTIKYLETKYPDVKMWELETPVQNYRNCHFYEKCGFVKVDEKVHSEKITLRIYKKIIENIL